MKSALKGIFPLIIMFIVGVVFSVGIDFLAYGNNSESSSNYKISNYYVKANILENGDLRVKELIVMDGKFNGYERKIAYSNLRLEKYDRLDFEHSPIYNTDGVKDVHISGKYLDEVNYSVLDDTDFEDFEEDPDADLGDKRVYISSEGQDRYGDAQYSIYKMFYPSGKIKSYGDKPKKGKVGFLIEYTLDNAVVMHDDVAELYWQFISGDAAYNDNCNDVIVKVFLPGNDTESSFKYWAHGPVSGDTKPILDDQAFLGMTAKISKLDKSEDLDVRLIFDKNLIIDDSELDHTNVNALSDILKVERKRADDANEQRAWLRRMYNFFKITTFVLLGIISLGFIFIKFKLLRKPKVDFDADYYREFIEDYNVEVIDYLFNKKITPNALSAAIMNLVYLKKVTVEEVISDDKKKSTKEKKDYRFTIVDKENLDESNTKLVHFLFDVVGDQNSFTTSGLKKYASSLSTGSTFNNSYTSWNNNVVKIGKSQNFYRSKVGSYFIAVILSIISLFLQITSRTFGCDYSLIPVPLILSILLITFVAITKAFTNKGLLHYKKWKAFKKFLNDFGDFEPKELPEIALWERYLVYATVFGIAKKVQEKMNVKINELGENVQAFDTNVYTNLYVYDSITSSFSSSVKEGRHQYEVSRANAYSSSSSSSGGGFGGGGFSSGGGFGGGGGGGHGF